MIFEAIFYRITMRRTKALVVQTTMKSKEAFYSLNLINIYTRCVLAVLIFLTVQTQEFLASGNRTAELRCCLNTREGCCWRLWLSYSRGVAGSNAPVPQRCVRLVTLYASGICTVCGPIHTTPPTHAPGTACTMGTTLCK